VLVRDMLKQIRMWAGTVEGNGMIFFIRFVNKNPVALNMAVVGIFPFTVERMITPFWRQGLFIDEYFHDFTNFIEIPALFLHQFKFFFKNVCVNRFKHELIVFGWIVFHKIFPHLIKRIEPICRDFPSHHRSAFFNRGNGFGIRPQRPALRVAVFGANGASALLGDVGLRSRCKSNYCSSRRNFAGKGNSAVSRYIYGLCDSHKEKITWKQKKIN